MKDISQFYKKCYFGSYPSQDDVNNLELYYKIDVFIDLTSPNETFIKPYTTHKKYIRFLIKDHNVPKNIIGYSALIYKILFFIEKKKSIYIHCKGGHGRSGILVACLLKILNNITPEDAIQKTTRIHNSRSDIKEKYKKMGSPQTQYQKLFVINFFKPYIINPNNCLHNSYLQTFKIPKFDYFISTEQAFTYFCHVLENEKIKGIFQIDNDNILNKKKEILLYNISFHKIKHNMYILSKLLYTGIRPIKYYQNNKMNQILMELRKYFFKNDYYKNFMKLDFSINE